MQNSIPPMEGETIQEYPDPKAYSVIAVADMNTGDKSILM